MATSGRGGNSGFKRSKPDGDLDCFGGGGWSSFGEYMQHKTRSLAERYGESAPTQSRIFKGVRAKLDGDALHEIDDQDVMRIVQTHGGSYASHETGDVTHLLANNLPAAKVKAKLAHIHQSAKKGKPYHVVTVAWLVDSAEQGRRLPERDYRLEELRCPEQQTLGFAQQQQPPPPKLQRSPPSQPLPPLAPTPAPVAAAPPPPQRGSGGILLHIDVDAMFVQCHQVAEPSRYPRDRPLAVQQHGDIIALNHLAKAKGVRKHMAPEQARAHATLVHVPTDVIGRVSYRLYQEASERLFALWKDVATRAHPRAVMEVHIPS